MTILCPLCDSSGSQLIYQLYDDRYGYPEMIEIHRCQACSHEFVAKKMESEQLTALYTNFYPRRNLEIKDHEVPAQDSPFRAFVDGSKASAFRWIPPNVKVLDIGCGTGASLGYHKRRGCDALGFEADQNVKKFADTFGYRIVLDTFNAARTQAETFDYVTMDQVLEHMPSPLSALSEIKKVINPEGVVVLSVPNAASFGRTVFGRRWIHWHVPYHQHFFKRKTLQLLAAKSGLDVMSVRTLTNSKWLLFQLMHLVTLRPRGQKSPFWSKEAKPTLLQRIMMRLIGMLEVTGVFVVMTRCLDWLGLGDNLIVHLKLPKS